MMSRAGFPYTPARTVRRSLPGMLAVMMLGIAGLSGCQHGIDGEYGRRLGDSKGTSVNGTAVLAAPLEQSGAKVRTARRLGRVIERADVIVWFPDQYEGPAEAVRERLEEWLRSKDGRTLIYVGREFDGLVAYWKSVLAEAPRNSRWKYAADWHVPKRRRLRRGPG